ncbi:hypothetical protein [Caldimonas brevitalea]|uniref:Uncharacterized protein n=1 Tax=Caldimonas brevitalea TaxID=413882 RepID=A0A0G3BP27_9BURK|nr:hypothetical protein [Caldimonas brevitalea]AKJ29748.1 hypothetical protein AAW51_3057 [Caldimonas brevitalea]
MSTYLFVLSLAVGVVAPILAVSYLRPILLKVLRSLCDADGGAEFWLRSAYLLAVCGTLLLILSFGAFEPGVPMVDSLRRTLWLVFAGLFFTATFIARNVWQRVSVAVAEGQVDRSPREPGTPATPSA